MKKVKILLTSILIIVLSLTIVFAFTSTYKQNRSGGYSSICTLTEKDKKFIINNGEIGEVTQMLYDTLTSIQWGKTEDSFGWTYQI